MKEINKLELLALAKSYTVDKLDDEYQINCNFANMGATISTDMNGNSVVKYFITGCYNTGCDWLEINIEQLEKLKRFCELMIEE